MSAEALRAAVSKGKAIHNVQKKGEKISILFFLAVVLCSFFFLFSTPDAGYQPRDTTLKHILGSVC